MLLWVVAQSFKPVKLWSQQRDQTFILFGDRRSVAQQCWIRLHSSSTPFHKGTRFYGLILPTMHHKSQHGRELLRTFASSFTFFTSSGTQGQIVGARESLNGRKNMAQKKSKERPEEPLETMSYQTSSKRTFRLSLAPTICPWVSEDTLFIVFIGTPFRN